MKHLLVSAVALVVGVGIAWGAGASGAWLWGLPVLVWLVLLAFVIQWFGYLHAWFKQTERFFDLMGSCSYIVVALVGLALGSAPSPLAWLLAGMVVLWALRLGLFLFRRVRHSGDDRFAEILTSPTRLFMTWTLQGLWISLAGLAAWIGIAAGPGRTLSPWSWLGVVLWAGGLAIEVVADSQKSAFKADAANRGRFIRSGLWAWSRHPNYFGEIVLWCGVLLAAAPSLRGWEWLAVLSPLFVTLLLTRVSGIPLLEKKADSRWGGQADYEDYKRSTSILVPLPPKR